ncbi:aldose 1-epimerase [Prauserella shujinwangii]|uniref:Aldose 1-epimerase n=1 Tax=Prauserella shujinwangii TaxID=1453103 RepID=A0A2T0LZ55_9PSEU|nr:aldose 1-epimerase family protein [Prauserella shujinwangii]PRX49406.1 aldose 1-epimerase [Prauserella shujinwangii]
MLPSGAQVELEHAGYRAVVTEVGAALRVLEHEGRPLVRPFGEDELMPVYSGAVLAPWPNRIGDGRYRYGGREYQVPLTEPERSTALHGLVAWLPWRPVSRSAARVDLACTLWPTPGYPFPLGLTMAYTLDTDGLEARLTAENLGGAPAPYGCSIHPYLVGGAGHVDDWTLELPAARYLDVDPRRLLPAGERAVEGTPFDFRSGRAPRGTEVDHAFGAIGFGPDGAASAVVRGGDGRGVRIVWDRACPWVQVHTADRPEPELHRTGLAVEPMTCPPDAFRTGRDLVHLAPGATHTVTWRLAAVS